MMRRRRDGLFTVRVEYDYVRVRAHGYRPFAREESEELRRRSRCQLDEAVHAYATLCDAAVIDQAHAVLHARAAVRNLCEVVAPHLFLLFETERAVVRRDHLKVVARQPLPQLLLVPLLAKRRRHHPLCALEPFALIEAVI